MFVDQQLRRLYVSQLAAHAELNCVIHGAYHEDVAELVTRYGSWNIIENRADDPEGMRELRTLRHLYHNTRPDDAVLFMHTKGIGYATGESRIHGITLPRNLRAINSWRYALEYFCIDRWQERLAALQSGVDTDGAFLNLDPYWNYCGNFWWARGWHIRSLPEPTGLLGISSKDAARAWLFYNKHNHMSRFHVLDKPREDGRYAYGTFRLHEDDMFKYLIEDRDTQDKRYQSIVTPQIIDMMNKAK